jgi:hypothetical protein
MFQFTGFPLLHYVFMQQYQITLVGFPIRKSTGQRLLAANRSLSQLATSFIGIWRQGIRRALFVA